MPGGVASMAQEDSDGGGDGVDGFLRACSARRSVAADLPQVIPLRHSGFCRLPVAVPGQRVLGAALVFELAGSARAV